MKSKFILNNKSILYGIIKIFCSGNGFVILENSDEKIFIPKNKTNNAIGKDKVKIKIIKNNSKKIEGEVIKIIKRENRYYTGIIFLSLGIVNNEFYIIKSNDIHVNIYISKYFFINKKINNLDKLIFKIIDWPNELSNPIGKVVKILGKSENHNVEMKAISFEYNFKYKFPKKINSEINKISKYNITNKEISKRKDMRSLNTFTIDPFDAKDFDDAISIKKLDNGNLEIGVHIADVSYYVKENSLIDKEASKRSTSLYLVNYVIPMLPEIISNELCSLKPNEDKLTFSVIFQMNNKADILDIWYGKTIICSKKRFSYEEAQIIIENKKGKFYNEISILNNLSRILKKNRYNNGSIIFDTVDVKFDFNKEGIPKKIFFNDKKDSHSIVEEFMLLTNQKISELANSYLKNKNFIYRIHDIPNNEKLLELKNIIKELGYKNKINIKNKKLISKSINRLLKYFSLKSEKGIINNLTIRIMSKATYSTNNIGHYGLAFNYYTHFTSPIRRYIDIIIHRLINNIILNKSEIFFKNKKYNIYEKYSKYCSERERLAAEAERKSIKFTQIKYIKESKKKFFEGIISWINNWNIYVELIPLKIDGIIHIRNIKNDKYIFNPKKNNIIGKKHGNCYKLGQKIKVKIRHLNIEKKYIELRILN